ncbi:MAG TPA: PP2C family protein-serine/threonine phosphatase [Thermoanaerobaculia bacterium]|nr:PP2C family protein-serine/threonine phosphatase [Thermoanaerobaculia bacterium]
MTDRPPVVRPLGSILVGALVFAAGLALALAWLPEWRAGRLPEEGRFVERYRELAGRAGVGLAPQPPQVALGFAAHDLGLAGAARGRRGPRAISPRLAGVKVTVAQEGTLPGDPALRTLALSFSPDGAPLGITWTAPGLQQFFTSPLQTLPRAQSLVFVQQLLAPGESLGKPLEEATNDMALLYALPGTRPVQHLGAAFLPGASLIAQRSPGTVEQALARGRHINIGTLLQRWFPDILLFFLVAGLFFFLVSRGRIDFKNGLVLCGLTLVASLGGLFHALPDTPSIASALLALALHALWVFLAWSAGESFIRSTSPDFTTSLDALRAGRLGPRGGRALLFGLALGAAFAGLRLAVTATALALPGIWPERASLSLPIFDTTSPVGVGIAFAAESLVLLAVAGRLLPRRWVVPAAALAGAFFLAPLDLHPWPVGYAANVALLLFLFEGGRRFGLTALLTAAMISFLLPAAAFSALHLDWLPGTFVLTAVDPLAFVFLGLLGLRRPDQVEIERLAPPAFIRRLEEERRVSYEMDLLTRMQLGLLPEAVPEIPGWEIAAQSLLATEAGGDLYDFLHTGTPGTPGTPEKTDGHLWIAAGDVAGHGYSCSIVQAMTTAALTSIIAPGRTPAEVLKEVDRVIRRGGRRRNFTSLALLRLDLATGQALLANAGHPYPLLLVDNAVEEIVLPGLPLGQGPKREYADLALTLPPGSVLILCSDGLFEAPNWAGDPYGYERPSEILRWTSRRPAQAILEALLADWRRHLHNEEPPDDTTVLVIKRRWESMIG